MRVYEGLWRVSPGWAREISRAKDRHSVRTIFRARNGPTRDLSDPLCCVVGEAHDFNADYIDAESGCADCDTMCCQFYCDHNSGLSVESQRHFVHHFMSEHPDKVQPIRALPRYARKALAESKKARLGEPERPPLYVEKPEEEELPEIEA